MAATTKTKEIQVQKPAQSLQAFRAKMATGEDVHATLLKPVLTGVGILIAASLAIFGYQSWKSNAIEKHETALAEVLQQIQGDGKSPLPAAELEKRMREQLPKLEALTKSAPASQRATTEGILSTWRLELDGKGGIEIKPTDPWSRLRLAQRQIALGQGKEALGTLEPLRPSANPSESWSSLYWNTLLEARQIQGDRDLAWKDYAEYNKRFRQQADAKSLDRIMAGI